MSESSPSWLQQWVALGGFGVIGTLLTAIGTYSLTKANSRKTNAEAKATETEISQLEAARSVDFEKVVNERVAKLFDAMEMQIRRLTVTIEEQSMQLRNQSVKIANMEWEIHQLTMTLEQRDKQLEKLKEDESVKD
jgi:hypothetical protein